MAFTIVMNVPGVAGDVTEATHSGWIRVLSLGWRARRALSMRTGSSADRESTTPAISEVEIKKEMDIASGNLLQKFLTNEAQTVNLDFLRTDDQVDVYCHITLTNAILSMFELESTGERPIEVLRLNFTKIEIRTTQMGPDGLPAAPFTTGYDLGLTKAF